MTEVAVLLALAAGSWLLRIGFLVLLPASQLPETVRSSLDHLAPAVLTAILVLDLAGSVRVGGSITGRIETLGAAAIIALVAWRTRNVALTSIVALAAVVLLDLLLA